MNPNPRIHQPTARSYVASYSSTPTITQSTALWKAMRHREEVERNQPKGFAPSRAIASLREAIASLPVFRKRGKR